MKKKYAFTLAETLMTLMIIGVIASMTIPSLKKNTEKRELESGFKKCHSSIVQALMRMDADGIPTSPKYYGNNKFKDAFMPYFNKAMDYGNYLAGDYMTGAAVIGKFKNYNYSAAAGSGLLDDGQFVTADGAMYMFENPGNGIVYISVDVNGPRKLPNAWGHDLFTFQLMNDGEVLPMGAPGTTYAEQEAYCSDSSNSPYNGIACTNKAIIDKDYWRNLP